MDETLTSTVIDHTELMRIIHSNHRIRQIVKQATNEFLSLQNNLLRQIRNEKFDRTIEDKSRPLIDELRIGSLYEQITADRVQLALVGENGSGKTSLIHYLLESDPFLPSDVGSVSARIIRLTYADSIDACLRVYPSLKDRNKRPNVEINLSEYFSESEPNWNAIKYAIEDHVKRPEPDKIKKDSEEFAKWATYFVEIRIPSPFLKLGIDLYDTPGLLYSDPPILKQNLHELVETIVPTVVFMYGNAAVISDTNDCFLTLKAALGNQIHNTSIYFLNTKVDIGTIITDGIETDDDEFVNRILINTRNKNKDLLLKVPIMAEQLSEGGEFNIISVHSQWDSLGVKMNQLTIDHLIQFVANSDLRKAKEVSQIILPIINSFFDFAFVTHHRTHEQLEELRTNAEQWAENYFIDCQKIINGILEKLFDTIIKKLNDTIDNIVRRAEREDTIEKMKEYIKRLIQYEIIEVIIRQFIKEYTMDSMLLKLFDPSLLNNANKNELLVATQQNSFTRLLNIDDQTSCQHYICKNIMYSLVLIAYLLIEPNEDDAQKYSEKILWWNKMKKKLQQNIFKKTSRSHNIEKVELARQYINDIKSGFIDHKDFSNFILEQCRQHDIDELKERINDQYQLAEKFLPQRKKAHELANKYAGSFARVECKLIVSESLTLFNGHIPTLNSLIESSGDEKKFFKFYLAEWLDKKDMIVKKLETPSDSQYLEAHYYQKLSKLGVPNYLPLLYLYQNDENELWMFFPKYECLENNLSTITIKNALKIILTIAQYLERLHANEFIHGDINVKNIFIINDEKYLLGDFYSKGTYETLKDYINRHNMNTTVWAYAKDIYSLGELGIFLYEYLEKNDENVVTLFDQFKTLLEKCLVEDPISRPKATQIVEELNNLIENA